MPKKETDRNANGEGSLYQRKDGRWEYKAPIGFDDDGNLRRKSFYAETPTAAKKKYRQYLKDNPVELDDVKRFGEWALHWLVVYNQGRVTEGTYYEYEVIVKKSIIPVLGKIKLPDLRPVDIEKLMRSVAKYSISRQKKVLYLTKAILNSAVENNYCERNVAANTKAPKAEEKEVKVFAPEHIKAILDSKHPFAGAVRLMCLTGLRRGELLGLTWKNVDLKEGVIHVVQALSDGEIKPRTKARKDRIIPIGPDLKQYLKAMPKRGVFVVSHENGKPLTKDQYNHRYKSCLKSMGIPYLSGHKCRASFATYLHRAGVDLLIIQELMGHADLHMTKKYTQIDLTVLSDNITKLKF